MAGTPTQPGLIGPNRFLAATNVETGIIAHAGGGQASAYQLAAQSNRVTTVASTGDSIALPKIGVRAIGDANPGGQGMLMYIRNDGANALQLFGPTPDTINGIATGTGVTLPANSMFIGLVMSYNIGSDVGNWSGEVIKDNTVNATFVDSEVPTGTINDVNAVFTLSVAPSPAASLQLFRNGILQRAGGVDYTLATLTITYVTAPSTGDTHVAWYRY